MPKNKKRIVIEEKKYNTAYLNISIFLGTDLSKEEIDNIIEEMETKINHKLIVYHRINGFEVE